MSGVPINYNHLGSHIPSYAQKRIQNKIEKVNHYSFVPTKITKNIKRFSSKGTFNDRVMTDIRYKRDADLQTKLLSEEPTIMNMAAGLASSITENEVLKRGYEKIMSTIEKGLSIRAKNWIIYEIILYYALFRNSNVSQQDMLQDTKSDEHVLRKMSEKGYHALITILDTALTQTKG
jgi:hypothetical protein